jgi:hypothetical protein
MQYKHRAIEGDGIGECLLTDCLCGNAVGCEAAAAPYGFTRELVGRFYAGWHPAEPAHILNAVC